MENRSEFYFVTEDGEELAAKRHTNPDGSKGGYVADTGKVSPEAFVHLDAIVGPGRIVTCGERIMPESPLSVEEEPEHASGFSR